jgi:hypothetical protein
MEAQLEFVNLITDPPSKVVVADRFTVPFT